MEEREGEATFMGREGLFWKGKRDTRRFCGEGGAFLDGGTPFIDHIAGLAAARSDSVLQEAWGWTSWFSR